MEPILTDDLLKGGMLLRETPKLPGALSKGWVRQAAFDLKEPAFDGLKLTVETHGFPEGDRKRNARPFSIKGRASQRQNVEPSGLLDLLLGLSLCVLELLVFVQEALNAAFRVHELFFARVERMAVRANFDADFWLGGAGFNLIATGAADQRINVNGVNALLHKFANLKKINLSPGR
jgi:hypothetical protein